MHRPCPTPIANAGRSLVRRRSSSTSESARLATARSSGGRGTAWSSASMPAFGQRRGERRRGLRVSDDQRVHGRKPRSSVFPPTAPVDCGRREADSRPLQSRHRRLPASRLVRELPGERARRASHRRRGHRYARTARAVDCASTTSERSFSMAKERRSLAGKVVAITGGARGIGEATARAIVAKGGKVAIGDLDSELAQKTAGSARRRDDRARAGRDPPPVVRGLPLPGRGAARARSTSSSTTRGSCRSAPSSRRTTLPPGG